MKDFTLRFLKTLGDCVFLAARFRDWEPGQSCAAPAPAPAPARTIDQTSYVAPEALTLSNIRKRLVRLRVLS